MIILLTLLSSISFIQYASALDPVAQIISVKSDGLDVQPNGIALTHYGQTPAKVTFNFRGFDDNHIREIRCSFDGTNYKKTNCPMVSAETRSQFAGPDGITRMYYLKTGTVSLDLVPRPTQYFFGIMVINDKQEKSLANWKFRVLQGVMPEIQNISALHWYLSFTEDIDPEDQYVKDGGVVKTLSGSNTLQLIFDYRGFSDDNILEFRCSFDGINYEKNNCSSRSAESQISFTGPDGVTRDHYTANGKAVHTFSASPNPYIFGVKLVTQNNIISPPKIFTFKVEQGASLPPAKEPSSMNRHVITLYDIQIRNTHEGAFSGDGEYDLNIYAHGKLFSLTDLSRKAGGYGLRDVSKDETVKFPPGSEIVVEVPKDIRFSIFTVGSEDDGCGKTNYTPDIQNKILSVFKPITKYNDVSGTISDSVALRIIQTELDRPKECTVNSNDDIDDIVKVFNRDDPGGFHGNFALSSSDFQLRFQYGWSPIYK